MEVAEEEWEREEECGSLKTRKVRKGKVGNPEANEDKAEDSESCVYLDRDKGLWKCHHCIWTHRMEIPGTYHFHNQEECSNGVMHFKTSSQRGSYFGLQSKGIGSADEIAGVNFSSIRLFSEEKIVVNNEADFETRTTEIQKGLSLAGSDGNPKHTNDEIQSSLIMISSEGQSDNGSARFEPIKDKSGANANDSVVDTGKIVVEMDVERVLEEQDTHDLYCPNCNSCITKRVILRKRKRIVQDLQVDAEREKIQPLIQPDVEARPDAAAANDSSHQTEPDVFRCLSCFSFFIPTATGFKVFPIFGRNDEEMSLQSPRQMPTKNLNCITSIFEMFTGKMTRNEPVKARVESDKEETVQPLVLSQHLGGNEALLHHSTSTTTSIEGVPLPDNSYYVGEHVQDSNEDTLQENKKSLVLLIPRSSLQETQIGNGEPGGGVKQNHAVLPIQEALEGIGNSKDFSKEQISGSGITQTESFRVNTMNPSPAPHQDSTLSNEKNNTDLVSTTAQSPQNIEINGADGVKDPAEKPWEYDKNTLISSTAKAWVGAESLLHVGDDLVEAPKKGISGSDIMQNDEKNKINLLSPSPYSREILSDEKDGSISINPNDHLLEGLRPSNGKQKDDLEPKPVEDENASLIISKPEGLVTRETKVEIGEILEDVPKSSFTGMINSVTPEPSQSAENISAVMAPRLSSETKIDVTKEKVDARAREWDILKSIVYGGLIESITSLGVVSSAAGSDATALNIVALGVANLISGLIVIVHNLRELKKSSIDQERGELDRYQATLGRRENFRLQATVSVLSYILFGLLPPVIYGFSFQKSDNREYKLIVVAAASLVCIILLAAGKAHVRSRNYISTVLYYVGIGVTASGLSFVVGELIQKLLEKLGWFESSVVARVSSNLSPLDVASMKSEWSSY